ncbi:hypothetical protein PDESU_05827 [Pontiella desulfatans]|uniref:SLA1 homology domain-containing protein n=1 Tax=Pontiella desulfatans TaxID=2750659 RepID=A0A6C2UCS8_PONDE|nr:hypothetical protein [Pontiella desulfatans]VGO17231.1 hypothetical protein PDESU_05827 [Pontiella desulfatans]
MKRTIGMVLIGLALIVQASPRTWTSLDGKTAEAEFQALEGGTLVLDRNGKAIRVPLETFCEEDQAFVHKHLEDLKAAQAKLAQEKRDRMKALLGLRSGAPITERRWADWKDYYSESSCGKKVLDFFKNEASIVDVRDQGVFVSPEHAVRPPDYRPTMFAYCPEEYTGEEKLGVYIHISPGNKGVSPKPGYQAMMDKHRLVYASPNGAGNKESDMRRCALALDTLAQLRKDFNIDERRVYIGGTSGGGAESTIATFLYPGDFRAAFNSVRSFSLTSSTCLPFADEGDIDDVQDHGQPYAFISGPGDFNYKYMPRTVQSFEEHDFVVRFFDIPDMKHQMASPETFDQVIRWVEANNPRLK